MKSIKEIFRSYVVFDDQGRHINGTDKQSNHNYGDAYESLFMYQETERRFAESSRNDIKLVMEVGVADGSCLCAWQEVFPNATIVGMDIHPSERAKGERIEFYLGDQCSKDDCERAAAGRKFDMIIDDGTHVIEDTLLTLMWLWPYVKSGGIYVIEDINSYLDNFRQLLPQAFIVPTNAPFGGIEHLIVLRKP